MLSDKRREGLGMEASLRAGTPKGLNAAATLALDDGLDALEKRVKALEKQPKACYFADVCPVPKPEPEVEPKPDEGGVFMSHDQWRKLDWSISKPEWWSTIREVAAEIHKRAEDCYAGDGLGTVVQLGTLYQWNKRLFEALGLKPHLPEAEPEAEKRRHLWHWVVRDADGKDVGDGCTTYENANRVASAICIAAGIGSSYTLRHEED